MGIKPFTRSLKQEDMTQDMINVIKLWQKKMKGTIIGQSINVSWKPLTQKKMTGNKLDSTFKWVALDDTSLKY